MDTYVEIVRQRLEDRGANISAYLDRLGEPQLRFTVRIFADCLDEESRKRLLEGYSEYLTEGEIRDFLKNFVPEYTAYAVSELEEKKREGERFDPPWLTQEEYQEMAVREKWGRIASCLSQVDPLQLRREIARAGILLRPYLLSDPGFNEGVLEFALYFDLCDRLGGRSPEELRKIAAEIAPLVEQGIQAGAGEECEKILRRIRGIVGEAAGFSVDPEMLVGPVMERYPREGPPGWRMRELRLTLETLPLKDIRLSVFAHIDLLTTEEMREIVSPFISRWPSFFDIPSKFLRELLLTIAERFPERSLTCFFDRYAGGTMAMIPAVTFFVWKLMPEKERIARIREDNARMDQAMMARHLARYLMSETPGELGNPNRQLELLTDPSFEDTHGRILKTLGGKRESDRIEALYDEVSLGSLRMAFSPEAEKLTRYNEIRELIAVGSGMPYQSLWKGEGNG
jgi:hypothetical protein